MASFTCDFDVFGQRALKDLAFFTLVFVFFSTNNEQANNSLTTLNLSYNEIGADGATAVAEALKVSCSLFCACFCPLWSASAEKSSTFSPFVFVYFSTYN
jgi:hypothetical protein